MQGNCSSSSLTAHFLSFQVLFHSLTLETITHPSLHRKPSSLPQSANPHIFSLPLIAASPSTSKHHPSPPLVPSPNPPTALPGHSLSAYASSSSPKLPGCNHTALTPASLASFSTLLVTAGGVTMLSAVCPGCGSAEGEGTVA